VEAIKIAQIILGQRSNPNQRQRIVLFVASGVAIDPEELIKLGRGLRKNSIAIDIVLMSGDKNKELLEAMTNFVEAVDVGKEIDDGDRRSRLLVLDPTTLVTEYVAKELAGSSHTQPSSPEFDDTDLDPELAMALKMSLDEEISRQQQQRDPESNNAGPEEEEDDPELAKAIAMSLEKH
jgi:26S proteasome regulatory subunit N10